jgi:hypothetical protein
VGVGKPDREGFAREIFQGPWPLPAVLRSSPRLAVRSVPHDGDVVFSTDAIARTVVWERRSGEASPYPDRWPNPTSQHVRFRAAMGGQADIKRA